MTADNISHLLRNTMLPRIEARLLMQHVTGLSHAQLIARSEDCLALDHLSHFLELVKKRQKGVPIAYLLGYKEFYGRRFQVSPDVLIPRSETELLIDTVLEKFHLSQRLDVLDLGTGSGILAITLALFSNRWRVVASDQSEKALEMAKKNAAQHNALVTFFSGSWFEALKGVDLSFDLIMSNPPYIAKNDAHLEQGDLRFEPQEALTDHDDGYNCYRILINEAPRFLNANGWIMLEHGYTQGSWIKESMRNNGFYNVETILDLAGLERVTIGQVKFT